jgi:hypothetical protein
LGTLVERVLPDVTDVLARSSQKRESSIDLESVRIGHKVERVVLLKAGKEAAVKGLLRQEGAAEVERPGHDIYIDRC